jgi:hypothetical protein
MEVERFKHRQLAPTVGPIVMITGGFEGPHHLDQLTDTAWLFINNSSCSIEHQFETNLLGADQSQLAVFGFKVDSTMVTATSPQPTMSKHVKICTTPTCHVRAEHQDQASIPIRFFHARIRSHEEHRMLPAFVSLIGSVLDFFNGSVQDSSSVQNRAALFPYPYCCVTAIGIQHELKADSGW